MITARYALPYDRRAIQDARGELRMIQIGIAVMIVILVFIAGWLQP
jgi:hypothetical protein